MDMYEFSVFIIVTIALIATYGLLYVIKIVIYDNYISKKRWKTIESELSNRYNTIKNLAKKENGDQYESIINKNHILIDVIIEKAQYRLKERSDSYWRYGFILYIFSFIMIIFAAFYITFADELSVILKYFFVKYFKTTTNTNIDIFAENSIKFSEQFYIFLLLVLKKAAAGGVLIGFCYLLVATANSCFRESTILLHRRHSLRLIRHILYANKNTLKTDDLINIFGVNDVMNSGFDKIKTIAIKDNWVGAIFEAMKNATAKNKTQNDFENDASEQMMNNRQNRLRSSRKVTK